MHDKAVDFCGVMIKSVTDCVSVYRFYTQKTFAHWKLFQGRYIYKSEGIQIDVADMYQEVMVFMFVCADPL